MLYDLDDRQQRSERHIIRLHNNFFSLNVKEAGQNGCGSTVNVENQSTEKRVKAEIVVIGNLIVKHIYPRKLTKKKVHKFTYPENRRSY